mgnify:CR=1
MKKAGKYFQSKKTGNYLTNPKKNSAKTNLLGISFLNARGRV